MKTEKHVALAAIGALNLSDIMGKLMRSENWTEEQATIAERWYKNFLTIRVKYPGESHVPSKMIDIVWHAHILDTKKYAKDCEEIFGEFMHHRPSYTKENKPRLKEAFGKTNQYYVIEFGEECPSFAVSKLQKGLVVSNEPGMCDCDGCDNPDGRCEPCE